MWYTKIQNTFAMVKHISRQGVASVCLMSLNWCKTPRGRPEPSLSGSKQRVGEKYKIQWKYKNKYKYEYKYKWKYKSKSKIQKTRAHHIREQGKSGREIKYIKDCKKSEQNENCCWQTHWTIRFGDVFVLAMSHICVSVAHIEMLKNSEWYLGDGAKIPMPSKAQAGQVASKWEI